MKTARIKGRIKIKKSRRFKILGKSKPFLFKGGMSFMDFLTKIYLGSVAAMSIVPIIEARSPKYITLASVYAEANCKDNLSKGLASYSKQHSTLIEGNIKFGLASGIGGAIYGAVVGSGAGPPGTLAGALAGAASAGATIMVSAVEASFEQLTVIELTAGKCSSKVECGQELFIDFDNVVNGRSDNDITEVLSYIIGYESGTPEGKAAAEISKQLKASEKIEHEEKLAVLREVVKRHQDEKVASERDLVQRDKSAAAHKTLAPLSVTQERKSVRVYGQAPPGGYDPTDKSRANKSRSAKSRGGSSISTTNERVDIILYIGKSKFTTSVSCPLKIDSNQRNIQLIKIRNNIMKQLLINMEAIKMFRKIFKRNPHLHKIQSINDIKHETKYMDVLNELKKIKTHVDKSTIDTLTTNTKELAKTFHNKIIQNFKKYNTI